MRVPIATPLGLLIKSPCKIKANDATKVYDGNPYSGGNGVVYSGFISGEGIAQLSGALSYSGSSQGAIATGTYVIQPGGFTADNYTLSYVNGSLDHCCWRHRWGRYFRH